MAYLRDEFLPKRQLEELLIEREIRTKHANWDKIRRLPKLLRNAVEYFIRMGDLRMAQKLARMDLEDFIELLEELNVPVFITVIDE